MKSSLEIAQEAELIPIDQIAESCGLEPDEIEPYGRYKAKIGLDVLDRLKDGPDGKVVVVAGMTPTKAGEGKTTTLVGLEAELLRDLLDRDELRFLRDLQAGLHRTSFGGRVF